jgi:hypothetical protein
LLVGVRQPAFSVKPFCSIASLHSRVSRPAEFHHRPLAEPSVRLSPHSAPIRQTCRSYGLSVARIEVLLFPVASLMRPPDPTPLLRPITNLLRSYESVRPSAPHRYARLTVLAAWASPLTSERLVPAVPRNRLHPLHAALSTPVAVRSVIRHPADLSQVGYTLLVSTTLDFLTTRLRRVHFRSSLGRSPARVCSRAFPPTLTTTALYRSSLEAV